MASQQKDGKTTTNVPACFFFAEAIDRKVSGLQVCKACENTAGEGSIVGAQRLYGLWRVYPSSHKARNELIMKGVTIDRVYVPIVGVSPMVVKGSQDSPTVKAIIGNIPLSVANEEIEKELKRMEGVKIRSRIYDESYRDENGKLTLFKSGRRFLYIEVPSKPLPTEFNVGPWWPSLYHAGQKEKRERLTEGSRPDVAPSEPTVEVGGEPGGEPVANVVKQAKQSKLDAFYSQANRSRPAERSPRQPRPNSASKSRDRKRRVSGEHARSPSGKASRVSGRPLSPTGQSGRRGDQRVDYFDYGNHPDDTVQETAGSGK